ncbi:hypothetical protein A1O1_00186 [Capronia coronata CBS 617.96]|uniref:Uncharacterized protein n=1 Tax=Capronia coronata CBS 617.96 TaxID=1182541 RepID=W9YR89_9EURO|nr:uncharacterized protein A1O1_00186 [Capronia coronata CBS 617.96]EXJ95068.1 hypothetical protein A1O1_00186 [Capronia coronata CBS 617.96]
MQLGGTASSTVSINQEARDVHQPRQVQDETPSDGPAVAVLPPEAPSSPAISALDSEHPQDAAVPSGSVSELTRPTAEHSPIELPQRRETEHSTGPEPVLLQHEGVAGDDNHAAFDTLTAPDPVKARPGSATLKPQVSDRSLNVPLDRRQSIISEVSSVSPGPEPGSTGSPIRGSISPADESPLVPEPKLPGESHSTFQAGQDSEVPADVKQPPQHLADKPAPASIKEHYSSPQNEDMDAVWVEHQSANEGVQNPPNEQEQDANLEQRPFSFAGLEGVGEIHQSQPTGQDLSKVSTQPLSPISQTLSSQSLDKEMSVVSAEEVVESPTTAGRKQSRSYSRPFGADPSVRNHPAFRDSEPDQPTVDRTRLYSSENPLPSARRPQPELERPSRPREQRQPNRTPQTQLAEAQNYRIPGPYVQEYRSPKQIFAPKTARSQAQVQTSEEPLPSTLRFQRHNAKAHTQPQRPDSTSYAAQEAMRPQSYQSQTSQTIDVDVQHPHETKPETMHQEQIIPTQRPSMGPPPVPTKQSVPPTPERAKKGVFGALFGSSSKSRSKLQKIDRSENLDNRGGPHKEKRNSLFRRNSRNDSISSQQSGQYGGSGQIGQLPPADKQSWSARRQSRELLRTPTPDQPSEAKKKRFSGFGNLFSKNSSGPRASMAPTQQTPDPSISARGQTEYQPSRTVMSPDTYPAPGAYDQYDDGPGQRYRPISEQWHRTRPDSPQRASRQQQHQSARAASPYRHGTRPVSYPYPTEEYPGPPPGQQQQRQPQRPVPSNTFPYSNVEQRRPADLRIDTSGSHRSLYGLPATAPAQIYPAGNGSFTSTGNTLYGPSPSPGVSMSNTTSTATTTRVTTMASPTTSRHRASTQQQDKSRAHVFDLHRRSRSPRLGRKSSSEDFDVHQSRRHPAQGLQPSVAGGSSTGLVEQLGTFSSKKISPAGGIPRAEDDQERPYAIDIPGLDYDQDHDDRLDNGIIDDTERRREQVLRGRLEGPDQGVKPGGGHSDTPMSAESDDNHKGRAGAGDGGLLHDQVTVTVPVSASRPNNCTVGAGHSREEGSGGVGTGSGDNSAAAAAAATDKVEPTSPEENVHVFEDIPQVTTDAADHRRSSARDVTSGGCIAELPGSKAEGYESEEDIPMSATAYPGQEWVPVIVGDGRWDDWE